LADPSKVPTIVDIGCGYGGLMFELQKEFPDKLILGMEIRDVVANFVCQKINSIRINSGYKECLNVGVVKTNTMKTLHNYFRKESVSLSIFVHFQTSDLSIAGEDVLLFRGPTLQEAEPQATHHQHDLAE
jgi:tRNA G46 methylase TrmB